MLMSVVTRQEAQIGGPQSRTAWAKTQDSIGKITKAKRVGSMAQLRDPEFKPQHCHLKKKYFSPMW
jgi:hypothetical protein